jgi:monofunctional biosynthetic peptidoglycan transglycosylase
MEAAPCPCAWSQAAERFWGGSCGSGTHQQQALEALARAEQMVRHQHRRVKKAKGRRWVGWLLLTVTLLGALLVGGSFAARSEWLLRRRIDPKLEALGAKLGGVFSYERIAPIGWTGVALRGLVFTPGDEAPKGSTPVQVQEIAVFPDVQALLWGEVVVHRVELRGVRVELWVDDLERGRGHWPWLEAVASRWQPAGGGQGGGGEGKARALDVPFPEVVVHDGALSLVAPGGSLPEVSLRLEALRIVKEGDQLLMDGGIALEGAGYALLSAGADLDDTTAGVAVAWQQPDHNLLNAASGGQFGALVERLGAQSRLSLRSAELTWPPALVLHGVSLQDARLRIPGQDAAYVEAVSAERVEVALRGDLVQLQVTDLDASARLHWMSGTLSTRLPIKLPRVDIGFDLLRRRVGLAVEVNHPTRGHLRAAGAYDLRARDLAFTLQAQRFDAGPLLSLIPYAGPIQADAGLLDGQLSLRYLLSDGLLRVQSDLGILKASVTAPWLSDQPLTGLNLRLTSDALVDLDAQTLSITDGTLTLGDLPLRLSGHIQRLTRRHVQMDLRFEGQDLPSEALLPSLPRGFAPALDGYALQGPFSLSLDLFLNTQHPDQMTLHPSLRMSAVKVLKHSPLANIPALATSDFTIQVNTASPPLTIGPRLPTWTPLAAVPDTLQRALLAAEDSRFFQHRGFDLKAIQSSLTANLEAGHIVRGGSTLTQQLAKNLFLSQHKTVARKLQETFLTWQLEQHLSKRRILELYLNMVHWGPGVYGVTAAARHYFNLKPSQLSLRESIFLAAILPNPNRFGQHYAQGFIQADRLQKMQNILAALHHAHFISTEDLQHHRALLAKAQISKRPRPTPAPDASPLTAAARSPR